MSSEALSYFPKGLHVAESISMSERRVEAQHLHSGTEEELLREVSRGSKEALGLLYQRFAPSVHRVALRILKDEGEAEDLVHELFLQFFRSAHNFDPAKGSASSWIITNAYHRALDRRRFLNVRHHYATDAPDMDRILHHGRDDAEQKSIDGIAAKDIANQFEAILDPEQRRTIELHLLEGHSFREIAEQTGQKFGNVRNQYYRGRERLRAHFFPNKEATK